VSTRRFVSACVVIFAVTATAFAAELQFRAEQFAARKGEFIVVLHPPFESHEVTHGTAPVALLTNSRFTIGEAIDDAFIGVPALNPATWTGGEDTDFVRYSVNVPESGNWYFWVRSIAPSQGDNSYYWAFDIDAADAVSGDTAEMNILDLYEAIPDLWTTEWIWFPFVSRTGPFEGGETLQWSDDRLGVSLSAGSHTLHLTPREKGYLDHFWATTNQTHNPNVDPPTAVEPLGKLTTTWAGLKNMGI